MHLTGQARGKSSVQDAQASSNETPEIASGRPRTTEEEIMDKLVLGWLLGVPLLMLIVLQLLA
ncbi:hypothetical protein [Herbaspirillum rubrisubalbicans]|uniref:hypothetical protein n=1 Tax=Herbaspirillum rubrisubalbicans TaxID=80842 RepID=UPI0012E86379|nr:hypothetical protein [Herbaspirillum rubrisubalbicans]